MKKIINNLMYVAIVVATSFALGACSNDSNDDPEQGGGNEKDPNYTFTINGKTFYYCFDYGEFLGIVNDGAEYSFESDHYKYGNVVNIRLNGSSIIPTYENIYYMYEDGVETVTLWMLLEKADFDKIKKGQKLEILTDVNGPYVGGHYYDRFNYLEYNRGYGKMTGVNGTYYNWVEPEGSVEFVSFKNDVLTLKLNNITMKQFSVDEEFPTEAIVNGTVQFELDEY